MVFAVVPPWLEEFAPYPATARDGSKNLLLVTGNMPGRKDAGRIWQARFDKFLRDYGLRQLVTDLRVWVRDTRVTSTTPAVRSHFYVQWAAEFNSPPEPTELSEDFTGLRHHRISKAS